MEEKRTVESMIPDLIREYLTEAEKLSKAYNISINESLQIMTLIELVKLHTHIDKMVDVLQLIEAKKENV